MLYYQKMTCPTSDQSDAKTCTYILRANSDHYVSQMSRVKLIVSLQVYLGYDHEVLSFDRLKMGNSSVIHNVVKVKTHTPNAVATKLFGKAWERQDHILFKPLAGGGRM